MAPPATAAFLATAANNPRDPLQEVADRYVKLGDLGTGTFGFVQLARHIESNELVAIKFIHRGGQINRYVEAEILNHRMLRHPHVIEFFEVFLTSEYVCIVMEYASGGSLFDCVKKERRLTEAAARWFFQQLIIGLDYCHRRGVVNRDIKLENTLLQIVPGPPLPLLKICDFGYSKAHYMSAPKSKVGTLAYMAPEIINATGNYDGKQADIWSCGVMLYVMLYGQYPFDLPEASQLPQARRTQLMMERVNRMQWAAPSGVTITDDCRNLLCRMLAPNPHERVTLAGIQQHRWFQDQRTQEAVRRNDEQLAEGGDVGGAQSVLEIKQLLNEARSLGLQATFSSGEDDVFENFMEDALQDEFNLNQMSFDVQQWTQTAPGGGGGSSNTAAPPPPARR